MRRFKPCPKCGTPCDESDFYCEQCGWPDGDEAIVGPNRQLTDFDDESLA
jgi:uncharacterized membrane protein YvbJ